MSNFNEGSVVICSTSQAGTLVQVAGKDIWVLLQNGDIFVGLAHEVRFPQDATDLAACPLNVNRLENKAEKRNRDEY